MMHILSTLHGPAGVITKDNEFTSRSQTSVKAAEAAFSAIQHTAMYCDLLPPLQL